VLFNVLQLVPVKLKKAFLVLVQNIMRY
jgi:hypothetical protein